MPKWEIGKTQQHRQPIAVSDISMYLFDKISEAINIKKGKAKEQLLQRRAGLSAAAGQLTNLDPPFQWNPYIGIGNNNSITIDLSFEASLKMQIKNVASIYLSFSWRYSWFEVVTFMILRILFMLLQLFECYRVPSKVSKSNQSADSGEVLLCDILTFGCLPVAPPSHH